MNILEIDKLLESAGTNNKTIFESYAKANTIINNPRHKRIICSVSGGSDSDIILDICYKVDRDKKIKYVWFDTGLEYQATKDHLEFLETKYGIEIIREKAIKTIPVSVREYGQPFLSKFVSQMIRGLQKHNFKWEDKPYEELIKEYPKAKSYIGWWTNHRNTKDFGYSMFNIDYNKYLKDFILENPPQFAIADRCCTYAKKNVSKELIERYNADLMIMGVRRSEGGARATAYKNCFTDNSQKGETSFFRPIFYYTNDDKQEYIRSFKITNSRCYTQYGMIRTGCAGCPFNRKIKDEMEIIEKYEPKLHKAINNLFGEAYEYTKKYREYQKKRKKKAKLKGQMTILEFGFKDDD